MLSNSVRAATCKPLCLAWPPGTSVIPGHFPIFLPGACNLCLASGSLSWLLSRHLSYQPQSLAWGPKGLAFFFFFSPSRLTAQALSYISIQGLFLQQHPPLPPPTDLALSLRLERLGRGPREVSYPSTAGLWSKPVQGPCWYCSDLRIHWGSPDCDFQSCGSGPLTVNPIPGWC